MAWWRHGQLKHEKSSTSAYDIFAVPGDHKADDCELLLASVVERKQKNGYVQRPAYAQAVRSSRYWGRQ